MSIIAESKTSAAAHKVAQARRIRVLFINDTSRNGGPGRTILYIAKFLDPALVHRTILVPREGIVSRRLADAGAAEEIFFERGLIENIYEPLSRPIERNDFDVPLPLKVARAAGNVAIGTAGFVRLLRRARKERYDLIFCNGTSAGFLGAAIAAATGIPAIWHVLYPSVPASVRPLHRALAASRNVRLIICVSRPTSPQFAHCSEKVRAIQTALDIDEFDAHATAPVLRKELGLDDKMVIFGSHGRILPRKGFIELIRAARIVVDKLEPVDRTRCRFVILGDTPQDMRPDHLEECRMLVRELNLTDQVQFIGFRPDVRPYVADFDVSIVPSVYEDPLPRAVMESMAMSKPVVAFAMGGIAEMIDDGVEGRLARGRPPDVETLAGACLDYFFDPDMRQRHGIAARKRIERDFDARQHARMLQDEMFRIVNMVG
ncbi:MAG: glycosyltransferase [Alphaproteobacteria bacterium]|nr:glycosyltransferase [Alphaproteobacteria bacterium]MDE2267272.1 glycosyltransferase [Alphaproteobacteria bacterium]